jgi:8-oxo-dGTP pyrophosphatase MutT (NUDIX family)
MNPADSPPAPLPRPAASLLVLRRDTGGLAVLMGLRGAGHRFMPNRLVFPGGAVEAADHGAPCAAPPRPEVQRLLASESGAALADALAACAARELQEETGLRLGEPPRLDRLDYLCRAITPAAQPVRFDARFFITEATEVAGEIAGSGELEDVRFVPVAEALALDLAVATRGVLERLREWLAMTPAQRATRPRVPLLRERVWESLPTLAELP